MSRVGVVLLAVTLVLGACDRSNPNRDLVSLDPEQAAYQPLPPLRAPTGGGRLPEPLYDPAQ